MIRNSNLSIILHIIANECLRRIQTQQIFQQPLSKLQVQKAIIKIPLLRLRFALACLTGTTDFIKYVIIYHNIFESI